jgi:hypothetical protein
MQQDILSGTFGIVIIVFLIVLFLLWFFLPFAVFGIKGRLDQLIQQNKQVISLLQNNKIEPVASSEGTPNKGIKVEPTITQPPQVYNTATGKIESEQ